MTVKRIVCLLAIFLIFVCGLSEAAEMTGFDVVSRSFYREDGTDSVANVEMILIDKKGNERLRKLKIFTKDYGELNKTYLEFSLPADIDGTRFLSLEEKNKDDTQYLYLPALGRARRIVSSQKKLSFVNTDFTYEDMQRRRPNKDTHVILRSENYTGHDCFVIESTPQKGTSQYAKRISWIDKNSDVILRTDFYNKKKRKIKEFRVIMLQKPQGIWTAMEVMMQDIKDDHTTIMSLIDVTYDQGVSDEKFDVYKFEQSK